MYEYQATIKRVIDGDTVVATIDLGFNITRTIKLRLADVDTHEIHFVSHDSDEYKQGVEEKKFVESWVSNTEDRRWPFIVETNKKGKYGRYIATIRRKHDSSVLNTTLLSKFEDVEY